MIEKPSASLVIKLFGTFEARLNSALMSDLHVREGERLLVLLILNQGYNPQGRTLASTLWPKTGSLDSLRSSATHLRKVLGDEASRLLKTPEGGYGLDVEGIDVDVIAFDRAVAEGDLDALQEAIARYRGPLLQGWEDRHPEDRFWVVRARENRKEKWRAALKAIARACLTCGKWEVAADYLKQYVSAFPADEWAWTDWMKALVEQGERVNAMNLFMTCRNFFHEKYQLPPPAAMSLLYQQLQQGIPSVQKTVPDDQARLKPGGGAVPLHSPYYIIRDTDQAFQTAITGREGLVLLKGPRQTGKTSLLARGLQQARDAGALVTVTDFQSISSQHWDSVDVFLKALAKSITEQLELNGDPQSFWSDDDGPNENFERYLKKEVLRKVPEPIVWAFDEVDRVFAYPFRNDVFGLFRSWYNDRALNPTSPRHRLTLALAYATEAHLFITDLNQSPFNVGTRLVLEDFTINQVGALNAKYGSPLSGQDTLMRFFLMVGGNPYLVWRGLDEIVARNWDFAAFEAQADQNEGCYGDHLQRMLRALTQDPDLSEIVRGLLNGKPCTSLEGFYRLQSAGILTGGKPEAVRFRCRVYKTYLGAHLK